MSEQLDVTLIKEHDDGSATYQFDLTPEHSEALLKNGILWAIVSGITGATMEQVLQDYMEKGE